MVDPARHDRPHHLRHVYILAAVEVENGEDDQAQDASTRTGSSRAGPRVWSFGWEKQMAKGEALGLGLGLGLGSDLERNF